MDFSKWNYLYNWNGTQWHRANLVYTPYVSPDKKTLCMSFNRDKNYHTSIEENKLWTTQLLNDRFSREIKFHSKAKAAGIPTLNIIDVDFSTRTISFEWYGADFHTQGFDVLPNWKEQWVQRIEQMWDAGIYKFSLHPNSWVAHNEQLIPFNWFFSFDNTDTIVIKDYLIQISDERQEKMETALKLLGFDINSSYDPVTLQTLAFHSFKSNYPEDLIKEILRKHALLR